MLGFPAVPFLRVNGLGVDLPSLYNILIFEGIGNEPKNGFIEESAKLNRPPESNQH